jgi:hypothetical protein
MERLKMLRLKQALGAYILASTLLSTVAAHAATYYVATTGNNGNPGTEEQPWRTVAHAVDTMAAGDTTYVRGGTYNESVIKFKRSGTENAPIKLLNYPGEKPVIDFIDKTLFHRIYIEHASGRNIAIGYITIEGFEIRDGWEGIKFNNLYNSVIRRNWIHDNRASGILGIGGHHNVFDRNIISHNGNFVSCATGDLTKIGTTVCNQDHGLYLHGNYYIITNNLIYDNLATGVQQNGSPTSSYKATRHPSPEFAGGSNWVIASNTISYQSYGPGVLIWGDSSNNIRIENNILYENCQRCSASGTNAVFFTSVYTATGITIRNNHAYASGSGGINFVGGSGLEDVHYTQSGNVVNVSPPGFVNAPSAVPVSPNFALTARSPAIDSGVSIAETTKDFNGTPRPQGRAPDIGAYEYTAGGDAQSPAAPKALQAN